MVVNLSPYIFTFFIFILALLLLLLFIVDGGDGGTVIAVARCRYCFCCATMPTNKGVKRIFCNVYDTLSKFPNITLRFSFCTWRPSLSVCVYYYFLFSFRFVSRFFFSQSLCRSVIFLHKFDRTVKLAGYFRIKKAFIVILQRMKMA